jgi:hypothetical protein
LELHDLPRYQYLEAQALNDIPILTGVCKMLPSRYMPDVLIRVGAAYYLNE